MELTAQPSTKFGIFGPPNNMAYWCGTRHGNWLIIGIPTQYEKMRWRTAVKHRLHSIVLGAQLSTILHSKPPIMGRTAAVKTRKKHGKVVWAAHANSALSQTQIKISGPSPSAQLWSSGPTGQAQNQREATKKSCKDLGEKNDQHWYTPVSSNVAIVQMPKTEYDINRGVFVGTSMLDKLQKLLFPKSEPLLVQIAPWQVMDHCHLLDRWCQINPFLYRWSH